MRRKNEPLSVKEVDAILRLMSNAKALSLDALTGATEDEDAPNAHLLALGDETMLIDRKVDAENALRRLNERERFIIERRYGLNGNYEHTLDELGALLHVTRERIRQIQKSILFRLRQLLDVTNSYDDASFLPEYQRPSNHRAVGDWRYGCKHWPSVVH